MIRNEWQLKVGRRRLADLQAAVEQATGQERDVLEAMAGEVEAEIKEYNDTRDGVYNVFVVRDIDGLGDALTSARISKGWTHQELAQRLGVSEQMVQRDEAAGYERAGLARLAEIADVLDYSL